MERYSILDQTPSGRGIPAADPTLKEEPAFSSMSRLPDDSSKSLTGMAQRDLEAALQLLAERAQYITGASGAAIALIEESGMICRASTGPSAPALGAEVQVKSSLTGESVRTRKVLRCDDAEIDPRVNRESCRALGIRSVMVVPLIRDQEVIGVFELLADRVNAFEERDVTALERLAEMVQTGLEHADAARRALEEIAVKSEQALASHEETKPVEPVTPLAETEKVADAPVPPTATTVERDQSEPARPKEIDVQTCEACGFPVSKGRALCVECEAARISGDLPAPLASSQPPSFLSELGTPRKQSWLGTHIYTIGTILIALLTVVLLMLRLR